MNTTKKKKREDAYHSSAELKEREEFAKRNLRIKIFGSLAAVVIVLGGFFGLRYYFSNFFR